MRRQARRTRRAAAARCLTWLVFLTAGHAWAQPTAGVPPKLQAPADQVLVVTARAQGVQIYVCSAAPPGDAWHWTLQAPQADLLDAGGTRIGTHYAGPTWESVDGSRVVGEVVARDDGPDPEAVPWLLLRAKSVSGAGIFAKVQSIQRVFTVGGKAPATGCGAATPGATTRTPYAATYYFYALAPGSAVTH
jgi:hypothetical protein